MDADKHGFWGFLWGLFIQRRAAKAAERGGKKPGEPASKLMKTDSKDSFGV